jgi:hypothetical protein
MSGNTGVRQLPLVEQPQQRPVMDDRPPWGVIREPQDERADLGQRSVIDQKKCPLDGGALVAAFGGESCTSCAWSSSPRVRSDRARFGTRRFNRGR